MNQADLAESLLFVLPAQAEGGAEAYTTWIINGLRPDGGCHVALLGPGSLEARLRHAGHRVELLAGHSRLSRLGGALALRRLIRRRRPSLVQATGIQAAGISALASIGLGLPLIWLKVDFGRDGWLANLVATRCTAVIGMSNAVLRTFRPRLFPRLRVVTAGIPVHEVDPHAGRSSLESLLSCGPTARIVALSGRLCPGKGQLELLEVAPHIHRRIANVHFALIGGEDAFHPGYRRKLDDRARQLRVDHLFSCLGHRDDAIQLVSGCDVLVAPSVTQPAGGWQEGFGLAVVEALQVRTPVVAYANGALPEVLGGCARIVGEGDRRALAQAVVDVLERPADHERLVECGQRRALSRYRVERVITEMQREYLTLASRE